MRYMTKTELRKLPFLQGMPYDDLLIAHGLIENEADVALIYFWYNLRNAFYYPCFTVEMVQKEVVYYTNRNPYFEGAIIDWFNDYLKLTKKRPHEVHSIKACA